VATYSLSSFLWYLWRTLGKKTKTFISAILIRMQVLSMELGNGLADRVVSAGSVPPPWGGQSSSPKGLTLYLWLRPQRPSGGDTPLSSPHPKHRYVTDSSHEAVVPLCMGGAGVRRFSRSAWENLLLKPEYRGLSGHHGSSLGLCWRQIRSHTSKS